MKTTTKLSTEMLAYYRRVSKESFTVVDLETTGVVGNSDRSLTPKPRFMPQISSVSGLFSARRAARLSVIDDRA